MAANKSRFMCGSPCRFQFRRVCWSLLKIYQLQQLPKRVVPIRMGSLFFGSLVAANDFVGTTSVALQGVDCPRTGAVDGMRPPTGVVGRGERLVQRLGER